MRLRSLSLGSGLLLSALLTGCGGGGGNTPPQTLSISTMSLPQGATNTAYNATLMATGGTTPYTWSIASGTPPAGVTLSAGGVLSGTPTTAGSSGFTVKVSDAETMPQTTTQSLTLAISGGQLQITSGSPPAGQVNTPFNFTLAATGGVPPYTWSLASGSPALPNGLTLSTAGLISGTPTAQGSSSPVVQVTDSTTTNTVRMNITVVINPAGVPPPDGNYSFEFNGIGSTGALAINGTIAVKNGAVGPGFYDKNIYQLPVQTDQPITSGSISIGSNGLGQLNLTLANGNVTFALASPASITTAGNDSNIRLIEFDDTTGKGTRGSGVLKISNFNSSPTAIKGSYAFGFRGVDFSAEPVAIAGSIQADGSGNITNGRLDENDAGALSTVTGVTGTYTVDPVGRVLLKLNLNGGVSQFSLCQVSPTELLAISVDQISSSIPLVGGLVLQQAGPFSNSSLNGDMAIGTRGIAPQGPLPYGIPDIIAGQAAPNGLGNISLTYDEYKGALLPPQSWFGFYTVDPATGRVVISVSGAPILYLVGGAEAFVLGTDTTVNSGFLDLQTGAPFTNASFKGNYLGGSLALSLGAAIHEAALVAADGNGNVVITYSSSGPHGLLPNQTLTGTYAVDSNGRVVVTSGGTTAAIFYLLGPKRIVSLWTADDGYSGRFEQ